MKHIISTLNWLLDLLIVIDIFFNVLLSPLLNILLSKDSYKFGSHHQTISFVMGKNIKRNKCRACKIICSLLSKFFKQKQHCIETIDEHEELRG